VLERAPAGRRVHPLAGVAHDDRHDLVFTILAGARADLQAAAVGHRVAPIEREVEHHLTER